MNWPSFALGEITHLDRVGIAPEQILSGTPYVGLENISRSGDLVGVRRVDFGELASTKFAFTDKHILYGKLRPYLRKIARPTFSGICSTDIIPVLPKPIVNKDYLTHFLRLDSSIAFATVHAVGANLPRISPSVLQTLAVPLPPLIEQQKIAAILNQAEALQAKRRQALDKLDLLANAIFADMFGDVYENERQWPKAQVADYVAEFQTGKSIKPTEDEHLSTYRMLKVSSVSSSEFAAHESKPLPKTFEPLQKDRVRRGDLLLCRANTTELVGATAYVWDQPIDVILPDKLWRFVWKNADLIDPLFVWFMFRQPSFRRELGRRATGTSGSMKNISQEKVLSMQTALPSITLQQQFGAIVTKLNGLKLNQNLSHEYLQRCQKALQSRAFEGEL